MKSEKPKHLYTCNTKIKDNPDGTAWVVKYRTSNLLKFTEFIQQEFGEWVWMKVYSNTGANKRLQLGYFTKKNPPSTARITK